jgi:hypothetical protein
MARTAMGRIQCEIPPGPEVGSHRSHTANTSTLTSATQKFGRLAPAREMKLTNRSKAPFGFRAASDPTTIAIESATVIAPAASARVVGNASSTRSSTGRCCRSESPKSSLRRSERKLPNCTSSGSSKPFALEKAFLTSTGVSIGR